MCKCTPEMRTPFCGKPGCEWPEQQKPPFDISENLSPQAALLLAERDEAWRRIDRLKAALQHVIDNDQTYYNHHQPRRDGKRPEDVPGGGSIWLTPREIAVHALRRL